VGHRPHIYVIRREPADPGVSPNQYLPQITVEVRAYWPARERHRVRAILDQAYAEAVEALEAYGVSDLQHTTGPNDPVHETDEG
jgi:hypothetical protein